MPRNRSDLTPRFKLVFFAVLVLTLVSLFLNALLVLIGLDTAQANALAETCSTTFKLGFGAIVGMIGSKAG